MTKFLSILLVLIFSFSYTYSNYEITIKDRVVINKMSFELQKLIDKNNAKSIKVAENKINKLLELNKDNEKMIAIFEEVKKVLKEDYENFKAEEKLKKEIEDEKNKIASQENETKEYFNHYNKYKIDFEKIKTVWLDWHNNERTILWRNLLSYDERLNDTAYEWSNVQKERWQYSHKRDLKDSYYNYPKIEKWFNKRWVNCEVSWWLTSTESIWYNSFYCDDEDCSDELLWWMKKTFNMYMKEKWKWKWKNAHYKSIVSKNLSKIWVWVSIKEAWKKNYYNFYLTTHYCTKFK